MRYPLPGELDHWPTGHDTIGPLYWVHPPPTERVIEPSAGDGSLVRFLTDKGHSVIAVEIRTECRSRLHAAGAARIITADWLETTEFEHYWSNEPFSIVGNPPYKPALVMLRHVEKCLETNARYIALLLPINFLCSAERWELHNRHRLTGLYPLARRPSTSGDGQVGRRDLAWFVWDQDWDRQLIQVLR